MTTFSHSPSPRARELLAKLVIGISAVVALATSGPPPWSASNEQELSVALDDSSEKTVLLTVEITGPLFQSTYSGSVDLSVLTDRAASDFRLEARALTPESIAVGPFAEAQSDGGIGTLVVQPALDTPARASMPLTLTCTELEQRPEACLAQVELRLARTSSRPLTARLRATATLAGGDGPKPPGGTLTIDLQELPP